MPKKNRGKNNAKKGNEGSTANPQGNSPESALPSESVAIDTLSVEAMKDGATKPELISNDKSKESDAAVKSGDKQSEQNLQTDATGTLDKKNEEKIPGADPNADSKIEVPSKPVKADTPKQEPKKSDQQKSGNKNSKQQKQVEQKLPEVPKPENKQNNSPKTEPKQGKPEQKQSDQPKKGEAKKAEQQKPANKQADNEKTTDGKKPDPAKPDALKDDLPVADKAKSESKEDSKQTKTAKPNAKQTQSVKPEPKSNEPPKVQDKSAKPDSKQNQPVKSESKPSEHSKSESKKSESDKPISVVNEAAKPDPKENMPTKQAETKSEISNLEPKERAPQNKQHSKQSQSEKITGAKNQATPSISLDIEAVSGTGAPSSPNVVQSAAPKQSETPTANSQHAQPNKHDSKQTESNKHNNKKSEPDKPQAAEQKKPEPKKADPNKQDVKQAEVKKPDLKKSEPSKENDKQADPKKAESLKQDAKPEPKKPDSKKAEPNKQESKQAEPNKKDSKQVEHNKQESKKAEPSKQEGKKTEHNKQETKQPDHNKQEVKQVEHNKQEAKKPESNKQVEPGKQEAMHVEPNKPEAKKSESNKKGEPNKQEAKHVEPNKQEAKKSESNKLVESIKQEEKKVESPIQEGEKADPKKSDLKKPGNDKPAKPDDKQSGVLKPDVKELSQNLVDARQEDAIKSQSKADEVIKPEVDKAGVIQGAPAKIDTKSEECANPPAKLAETVKIENQPDTCKIEKKAPIKPDQTKSGPLSYAKVAEKPKAEDRNKAGEGEEKKIFSFNSFTFIPSDCAQKSTETPSAVPTTPNRQDPSIDSNKEKPSSPKVGESSAAELGTSQNNQPEIVQPATQPDENLPAPGAASEDNPADGGEEGVNVQELTEHVMNILNEGGTDQQELLKKNVELQQFIVKLIHLLKEKTDLCINLDRQNSALTSQAKSLKDVISITKDLLGIRNMEIERLHGDLNMLEGSVKEERNRHNQSVQHLSEAMGLNDKLKKEYHTQMDLFEKLKEKYTEKVVILTRENLRMKALLEQHGINPAAVPDCMANSLPQASDPSQPDQ